MMCRNWEKFETLQKLFGRAVTIKNRFTFHQKEQFFFPALNFEFNNSAITHGIIRQLKQMPCVCCLAYSMKSDVMDILDKFIRCEMSQQTKPAYLREISQYF